MEVLEHKERERVSESERKIVNDRIWELGLEVRGKSEIYKRNLEVLEHKERERVSESERKIAIDRIWELGLEVRVKYIKEIWKSWSTRKESKSQSESLS